MRREVSGNWLESGTNWSTAAEEQAAVVESMKELWDDFSQ